MALESKQKENVIMLIWVGIFVFVYIMFLPIKGDKLSHFPFVYGYMLSTFLLVLILKFFFNKIGSRLAARMSMLILSFAILFPAASFLINGKGHFIRHAAEYNHPALLHLLLDTSNQEEVDMALHFAKVGENPHIVESLTTRK